VFRKLDNNCAANEEGIQVRGVDRFFFEYVDGGKVLLVPFEGLIRDDGTFYESVSINMFLCWKPPCAIEVLTKEKLDQIEKNIVEALDVLGWNFIIDRDRTHWRDDIDLLKKQIKDIGLSLEGAMEAARLQNWAPDQIERSVKWHTLASQMTYDRIMSLQGN